MMPQLLYAVLVEEAPTYNRLPRSRRFFLSQHRHVLRRRHFLSHPCLRRLHATTC
jgi:hypothetical protein